MSSRQPLDAERILFKVREGKKLSSGEVRSISKILESFSNIDRVGGPSLDEVYIWLLVLREGNVRRARYLLERFLEIPDPITVSLVLEVLCGQWGFLEDYFERVVQYALGVAWDYECDVQNTALKILGESLTQFKVGKAPEIRGREHQVLELLRATALDSELDRSVRSTAYQALCRGTGEEIEEDDTAKFEINPDVVQQMVQKIKGSEEEAC